MIKDGGGERMNEADIQLFAPKSDAERRARN